MFDRVAGIAGDTARGAIWGGVGRGGGATVRLAAKSWLLVSAAKSKTELKIRISTALLQLKSVRFTTLRFTTLRAALQQAELIQLFSP